LKIKACIASISSGFLARPVLVFWVGELEHRSRKFFQKTKTGLAREPVFLFLQLFDKKI
jgi:hypothetical protein